jgi:hypothetical protein
MSGDEGVLYACPSAIAIFFGKVFLNLDKRRVLLDERFSEAQ